MMQYPACQTGLHEAQLLLACQQLSGSCAQDLRQKVHFAALQVLVLLQRPASAC